VRITQTRFKLAVGSLALSLGEGILVCILPQFPLTEVLAAQGLAIGAYFGAKTVNNIKDKKYDPYV